MMNVLQIKHTSRPPRPNKADDENHEGRGFQSTAHLQEHKNLEPLPRPESPILFK